MARVQPGNPAGELGDRRRNLKSLGTGGDIGGDIVYGDREFEDFELSLEWKISDGGNSGIFYHVLEGEQYKAPYENAPEYQLIDDIGFPENPEDWAGGRRLRHKTPPTRRRRSSKSRRVEYLPDRLPERKAEYWLNGQKVVDLYPGPMDWMARRNSGNGMITGLRKG